MKKEELNESFNSFYMENNNEIAPYENILNIDTDLPVHSVCDLGDKIAANSKKYLKIYDQEKDMSLVFSKEYEYHLHHGLYSTNKNTFFTGFKKDRTTIQVWDLREKKVS